MDIWKKLVIYVGPVIPQTSRMWMNLVHLIAWDCGKRILVPVRGVKLLAVPISESSRMCHNFVCISCR